MNAIEQAEAALNDAAQARALRVIPSPDRLMNALRTLLAEHKRVLAHPLLATVDMNDGATLDVGEKVQGDAKLPQNPNDAVMTTTIEQEARAEAERRHPSWHQMRAPGIVQRSHWGRGFEEGALWWATRKPTEAEVGGSQHDRDDMGICRKCGRGLSAAEVVDGEGPCPAEPIIERGLKPDTEYVVNVNGGDPITVRTTTIEQEARAEAERRWPIPVNFQPGDPEYTILSASQQAYVLGRLDQATHEPTEAEVRAMTYLIDDERRGWARRGSGNSASLASAILAKFQQPTREPTETERVTVSRRNRGGGPITDEEIDAARGELIARINSVIQPTRGTIHAMLEAARAARQVGSQPTESEDARD